MLREIGANSLAEAMGRRFTVTLARDDFHVCVNGEVVTEADALPDFEHKDPRC